MVTVGGAIAVAAVTAVVVKLHTPTVKDAYFKPDFDSLKQVPAGIVAVRPMHSKGSIGDPIRNLEEHDTLLRAVGRGVTFRDLIAEAYDCRPGRAGQTRQSESDGSFPRRKATDDYER